MQFFLKNEKIKVIRKNQKMYTFFYETKSPFSNWYPCEFWLEGKLFSCSEQCMMWQKARLFGDSEIAEKILQTDSPKTQKALGRKVKNFNEKIWDQNKEYIVLNALRAKFSQNPDLSTILQNTFPTTLVEASPWDKVWGIGYDQKTALKVGEKNWGQNLLGKLLTQIRDEKPVVQFIDEEWSWKTISLSNFLREGNIPLFWKKFFYRKDIQKELENISEKIPTDCTVYPPPNLVFNAFKIPLENIALVIIGQDPYHDGNATGFCFSVPVGSKINPSLRNIYQELERDGYIVKKNGDISHWATQGCFMLNTALTVEKGDPESHLHLWYTFTEKLIEYIATQKDKVAWLLMGAKAIKFKPIITKANRGHKVFETSHPSPFSAYNGFRDVPAFIGSGIFTQINSFVPKKIEW